MELNLKPGGTLYFMGIGGTGMAAVAGLMQEAGYQVEGSDKGVYPPMSSMLEELGIAVKTPYAPGNLTNEAIDLVVVANALSRGNPEVEYMLEHQLAYTSFPGLLGQTVLAHKQPIVVSGTHGKTTTTTLAAHMLEQLGEQPGFLIGGLPKNFSRSFRLGAGPFFVIEGDEYDTAFFDKESKFLHYRPHYLIVNNLEFDHADIFSSLEDIEAMFLKLMQLVPDKRRILANMSDTGVVRLMDKAGITDQVTKVITQAQPSAAGYLAALTAFEPGPGHWQATIESSRFGRLNLQTSLTGEHNLANLTQVIALLALVAEEEDKDWSGEQIAAAVANFAGVARRLDFLGETRGVRVYEDFAHHPTAIQKVLAGMRKAHPETHLVVAFEPVNATGRRNVLMDDFADALSSADQVWLGKCPVDERIPAKERMDTAELARRIGNKARCFTTNEELLLHAAQQLQPNSTVLFMSPGSFSGIQHQLVEKLAQHEGKTVDPKESARI